MVSLVERWSSGVGSDCWDGWHAPTAMGKAALTGMISERERARQPEGALPQIHCCQLDLCPQCWPARALYGMLQACMIHSNSFSLSFSLGWQLLLSALLVEESCRGTEELGKILTLNSVRKAQPCPITTFPSSSWTLLSKGSRGTLSAVQNLLELTAYFCLCMHPTPACQLKLWCNSP